MKWYEDLSIVADRFGISEEAILKFNGLSSAKEAKQVKTLKIPTAGAQIDSTFKVKADTLSEKIAATPTSFSESIKLALSPEANMALIIPFSGEGKSESYFDFYSGVLMAVRDLGRSGMKINLSVYDYNADGEKFQRTDLSKFDFIIGPVDPNQLQSVERITPECTFLISPLDPKAASQVDSCSNFIQGPTPSERQYEDAVAWLAEDMLPGDKVFLFKNKQGTVSPAEKFMALSGIPYQTVEYGILEGRNIQPTLENGLEEGARVRAIITSDDEAFTNDVVRNLNLMTFHKFDVTLYGVSKMKSFETIESEALHNVHFHMSTSYHVDYDHTKIKNFLLEYRALFNCEPSPFAYQGYDLSSYFITFRTGYRGMWKEKITKERYKGLQSDFIFENIQGGGYINKAVRRVVFGGNYSIALQN